jgi:hypothetical protein
MVVCEAIELGWKYRGRVGQACSGLGLDHVLHIVVVSLS